VLSSNQFRFDSDDRSGGEAVSHLHRKPGETWGGVLQYIFNSARSDLLFSAQARPESIGEIRLVISLGFRAEVYLRKHISSQNETDAI
jgi:hypothetical protein